MFKCVRYRISIHIVFERFLFEDCKIYLLPGIVFLSVVENKDVATNLVLLE